MKVVLMSTKRTKIIKELDPQEVEGFSEARKEHYLFLGYRPYLNEKDEVKWLTPAQMTLRASDSRHWYWLGGLFQPKYTVPSQKRRRRRRFHLWRFLAEHWLSIVIVIVILASLVALFFYPDTIF